MAEECVVATVAKIRGSSDQESACRSFEKPPNMPHRIAGAICGQPDHYRALGVKGKGKGGLVEDNNNQQSSRGDEMRMERPIFSYPQQLTVIRSKSSRCNF
jgi:hypothetical protein